MEIKQDSPDVPWLREMVEEDLHALFAQNEEDIARAVRHYIDLAISDASVVDQLIDLVETALEYENDDANASLWSVVVLGESGALQAVPLLRRALMCQDETLQDAACVALLRLGANAIESVMEAIDEDEMPRFNRSAYPLLGMVGILDDPIMTTRVSDFLQERLSIERRAARNEQALEEIVHAIARVGDRRQLEALKEILSLEFRGHNPVVQDAIEMLEENADGVPIGALTPPWEERYGWILQSNVPRGTLERSQDGNISLDFGDGPTSLTDKEPRVDQDGYRRGLFLASDVSEEEED